MPVPIVAYNVNYNKIAEETDHQFKPYTTNLKSIKKEFENRNLPWNDDYADYNNGYYSLRGKSIIDNYDENKDKFIKAGIPFDNNVINSSTGKLNSRGQSKWDNYQKQIGFQGAPEDGILPEQTMPMQEGSPELTSDIPAGTEIGDPPEVIPARFDNYEHWDLDQFRRSIKFLQKALCKHADDNEIQRINITAKKSALGYRREDFKNLLDIYKALKPDINVSQYENYTGWGTAQLKKNLKLLRDRINKIQGRLN